MLEIIKKLFFSFFVQVLRTNVNGKITKLTLNEKNSWLGQLTLMTFRQLATSSVGMNVCECDLWKSFVPFAQMFSFFDISAANRIHKSSETVRKSVNKCRSRTGFCFFFLLFSFKS